MSQSQKVQLAKANIPIHRKKGVRPKKCTLAAHGVSHTTRQQLTDWLLLSFSPFPAQHPASPRSRVSDERVIDMRTPFDRKSESPCQSPIKVMSRLGPGKGVSATDPQPYQELH